MTDGQRYRRTYIYPPLDKRYSPIISSICGPNNQAQSCLISFRFLLSALFVFFFLSFIRLFPCLLFVFFPAFYSYFFLSFIPLFSCLLFVSFPVFYSSFFSYLLFVYFFLSFSRLFSYLLFVYFTIFYSSTFLSLFHDEWREDE